MKHKILFRKMAACAAMFLLLAPAARAQGSRAEELHFTVDWQMNAPLSTGFADKIGAWGMNFEGAYDVTSRWSVGLFLNFHTNHRYVGWQTLPLSPTESLTTDQQRSAYQLPFGVQAAYKLYDGAHFKPYVGAKAGAAFARNTTYYGTGGVYDEGWGFYAAPELGFRVYPSKNCRFGFHVAGYYSYMTNRTETLLSGIDGQSNAGFRLGVTF